LGIAILTGMPQNFNVLICISFMLKNVEHFLYIYWSFVLSRIVCSIYCSLIT
jgi:hypothetical protein